MEKCIGGLWHYLERNLFRLPGQQGKRPLFNPYLENDPDLDLPSAGQIRRENLRIYLSSFVAPPLVMVIGEAPGWRGCRFSGVPFTSEAQLVAGELPFGGQSSNKTRQPLREASATIFWQGMRAYHPHFIAWNCLPLHPFKSGHPTSNRHVSTGEVQRFDGLLRSVIAIISPQAILCVGREAGCAMDRLAVTHTQVRHPAHGGARAFRDGIERFFGKLELFSL